MTRHFRPKSFLRLSTRLGSATDGCGTPPPPRPAVSGGGSAAEPRPERLMRIVVIGGGPAGLCFSILMRQQDRRHEITLFERNRPDDTFGWGVVFSDQTLLNLAGADPETQAEIAGSLARWDDIDVHIGGRVITSSGHGFSGIARRQLLQILQRRAGRLGVQLAFETEVETPAAFPDADLIVAADGINSRVRSRYAAHFQPEIERRDCRYVWLGTTRPFAAFTFAFEPTEWGWFQAHAYRFGRGRLDLHRRDPRGGLARRRPRSRVPGREHPLLRAPVRPHSRRPPSARQRAGARQRLDLGQLSPGRQPDLGQGQPGPDGRCRAFGAFLDRLGHQARPRGCDRARPPTRRGGRAAAGCPARGLRGRAQGRGPEAAVGGAQLDRVVRERRALCQAAARAVRLQPAHPQPAGQPREPPPSGPRLARRLRALVRRARGR